MRSGPSTRTTACVTRRQVKWCGGPSGTVANGTLIGSGFSNSRKRPQRRLALDARGPGGLRRGGEMMLRRRRQHRAFGNMGVLRQMHDDALSADARGDAVDQRGQFVIVMDIGVEIALLLHHDLGAAGGKTDEIEAEAGIERIVRAHRAVRGTGGRSPRFASRDVRYRP